MADIKVDPETELSKQVIFDMFYQKQTVSRSGGGTQRKKMGRVTVTSENIDAMEYAIKQDPENNKLLAYYINIKNRKASIAPPPRPNN
jgi:hypothetical protein